MKNKKSIYILLPIVLFIWGMLIYQFFSFSASDDSLENTVTEFNVKPFKLKERTSFSINVNYRDPFLGKIYAPPTTKLKKSVGIKKQIKPQEELVWPSIKYKGTISDAKQKNKLFIMVIDGHNFYMKKGDTENEVFLKDGDNESVYVKYKGNLNLIMLAE
ncbi:hypothetical protein [Flavobacterium eburneipallidum]|uniref:hypothetical protein n=1 Tax=Flavobacterium eburneipallidum TaxID=3003263 RepID=UPI0022ABD85F|nr:hypothetical protein [Flavobacterium eburneipallidum]